MLTFIIFLSILSWVIFVFFRINLKYFYIIIYIFFIFYYFFLTLEVEPIFFLVDNIDNIDNMAEDINLKDSEINNENLNEKSYFVQIKNTLWDYKYYILGTVVIISIAGILYVYYGNFSDDNFCDESIDDSFDAAAIIDDIFEKTRSVADRNIDRFFIDAETVEVDGVRYNIYDMEDVDPSVDPETLRRLCIYEHTVDKTTLYNTPPPGPARDALLAEWEEMRANMPPIDPEIINNMLAQAQHRLPSISTLAPAPKNFVK